MIPSELSQLYPANTPMSQVDPRPMNKEWFDRVCMSALGWRTTQEATYDVAKLVLNRGIVGDFVECGVYAGAASALMARAAIEHFGDERVSDVLKVRLFDSFEGIPKPGPHDTDSQMLKGGEAACSLDDVRRNMYAWGIQADLLVYHPGWFVDTVPAFAATKPRIALLRLDGDLYESTSVVLKHLYPLVTVGGYIIVDDFNLAGCRKAVIEQVAPAPIMFRKDEGSA